MANLNNPNNKYAYKNKNGKWVYGPAAHNHYIHTICGGVDGYEKELLINAFAAFINSSQYNNRYDDCKDIETNIIDSKDLWN